MRVCREFRAFTRFENREDDPRDDRADELRDRGVDIQNPEVDPAQFPGGTGRHRRRGRGVAHVEGVGGAAAVHFDVAGEAVVGRAAAAGDGEGGAESVDFDADEGAGCEAGDGGRDAGHGHEEDGEAHGLYCWCPEHEDCEHGAA